MATAKKDTVKVRLPLLPGSKNQTEFFSVNGKNYKIKRGVYVDVPACLAEVIENGNLAADAAIQYAQDNLVRSPDDKTEQ